METVGERIKARRVELKMTQDALCQRADISKGFLSDLENNNRGISANNLLNIANALGSSLEYLLTGKPEQKTGAPVNVPEKLVSLAQQENLSFNTIMVLMDMKQQIMAHRSDAKSSKKDDFDWGGFYDSVKQWLPKG